MLHLQDAAYDEMNALTSDESEPIDRLSEDEPSDVDIDYAHSGTLELGTCLSCETTVTIDGYANRCLSPSGGWICSHCHTAHVVSCTDCWEF